MKHNIDCPCPECENIRKMLKKATIKGKIYLSGTVKDKAKIMGEKA